MMQKVNAHCARALILVFQSILLTLGIVGCSTQFADPPLPRPAPAARLIAFDGTVSALSKLRGQTVVILFWSLHCARSNSTIRELNALAAERSYDRGLRFISINVDKANEFEKVQEAVAEKGLDRLQHMFSGNDVYDEAYIAFGVDRLPRIFVINASGQIVAQGGDVSLVESYLRENRDFRSSR